MPIVYQDYGMLCPPLTYPSVETIEILIKGARVFVFKLEDHPILSIYHNYNLFHQFEVSCT